MKRIYIAYPFRGNQQANTETARLIGAEMATMDVMPVIPHMALQYLDEASQRDLAMAHGKELLSMCDELWICSTTITDGMVEEITYALDYDIPVINMSTN